MIYLERELMLTQRTDPILAQQKERHQQLEQGSAIGCIVVSADQDLPLSC